MMTCNFLKLNSDKTEVILLGPEHLRDQRSGDVVSVDDIALASTRCRESVLFDQDLSFNSESVVALSLCSSGHMISVLLSILERDPPVSLLKGSYLFSQ